MPNPDWTLVSHVSIQEVKTMRTPFRLLGGAALVFVITLSSVAAARDPIAPRLIGVLNDRIQERFKDVENGLGMSRIVRIRPLSAGPHQFEPENLGESAVLRDLEKAGVSVVLYLGSASRRIKGPVLMTRSTEGVAGEIAMPEAEGLRESLNASLAAFRRAESYEFGRPGWKFIARPVRASSQKCLNCHEGVSLGEPVGVVMYAYGPAQAGPHR